MGKSSIEMRREVQEIHVKSWHEAMEVQLKLENEGYFCSFMKKKGGFVVYFWF